MIDLCKACYNEMDAWVIYLWRKSAFIYEEKAHRNDWDYNDNSSECLRKKRVSDFMIEHGFSNICIVLLFAIELGSSSACTNHMV